jgi:hypothetical protein
VKDGFFLKRKPVSSIALLLLQLERVYSANIRRWGSRADFRRAQAWNCGCRRHAWMLVPAIALMQ